MTEHNLVDFAYHGQTDGREAAKLFGAMHTLDAYGLLPEPLRVLLSLDPDYLPIGPNVPAGSSPISDIVSFHDPNGFLTRFLRELPGGKEGAIIAPGRLHIEVDTAWFEGDHKVGSHIVSVRRSSDHSCYEIRYGRQRVWQLLGTDKDDVALELRQMFGIIAQHQDRG